MPPSAAFNATVGGATMTTHIDADTIEGLRQKFKFGGPSGSGEISFEGMRQVLVSLGHQPSANELRHLHMEVDAAGGIGYEKFTALLTALHGDVESRLKIAFDMLDENGDGVISPDELRHILSPFGLTDTDLDLIFREADQDGDGSIDFDAFSNMMPENHGSASAGSPRQVYRDSPTHFASGLRSAAAGHGESVAAARNPTASKTKGDDTGHPHGMHDRGTSRLQMQISLFRLLQGAAYRCFRENYSANYETHLRAKKLPYTINHFVEFTDRAIEFYKALGVVEPAAFPVLDAVTASLRAEYDRLMDRIANWPEVEKTPEMLATDLAMREHRTRASSIREKFAAGVELALTLRKKNLTVAHLADDPLTAHELNRLRRLELHQEMAPAPTAGDLDAKSYLQSWNRVLLEDADEEIDGAMMPTAFWYEDFMPKLLAAFSVGTGADVASQTVADEVALDSWFAATLEAGEFDQYGTGVAAHFQDCDPGQKLAIRQAWRLTRHYLNGVQKRREREEFGRESGFLSQYVAFLDVYLGRHDIRDEQMRVSFPYYLGPAAWRFFHTSAEIICSRDADQQKAPVELFKEFFGLFATMYPCPYCRYHLNRYVVRNRELTMYPLEYLVLGLDPDADDLMVSIDDKLNTLTGGPSLRLFLWKLHNAVSSSIARTEPWFHQEERPFYTTRYWPGLDSELARARALNHDHISIDRLGRLYGLLKPASVLASLHRKLGQSPDLGGREVLSGTVDEARELVGELDVAIVASEFLERTYTFDPALNDDAPHFTHEDEEFGRSGVFVEV